MVGGAEEVAEDCANAREVRAMHPAMQEVKSLDMLPVVNCERLTADSETKECCKTKRRNRRTCRRREVKEAQSKAPRRRSGQDQDRETERGERAKGGTTGPAKVFAAVIQSCTAPSYGTGKLSRGTATDLHCTKDFRTFAVP